MNDKQVIPEDQVNAGGTYDPVSRHVIPMEDEYVPWHQGEKPPWMVRSEGYAEYAKVSSGALSLVNDSAHRVKIDTATTFTNTRRYHDWKGYDYIEPCVKTVIKFNDIQVGVITHYAANILSHYVEVVNYMAKLRDDVTFPVHWWSEEELNKLLGRQVTYDGHPAVIIDVMNSIGHGEITVYAPTWPDDGYDRGGRLRTPIFYHKLDWNPKKTLEEPVTLDTPYTGAPYVEEDQ